MRFFLPLLALAACSGEQATAPAPAQAAAQTSHAAPAAGGAAGDHAHTSPHGGIVKTVGERHVEALFLPGGVMFYLSDAAEQALPIEGFSGTAVVKGAAGVETVTLAPMGDHLHAAAKLGHGEPASVVLTLNYGNKAESVSFEVPSVGLAEHDHTSLHGGQVGMWGDFHLEYLGKDDEHRVWVTSARRLPVTQAVSGSLKDGDTVVPLTFDAATGMLSGKAPGAGSRAVLVDVKVGESSFSVAFNAVEKPAGGAEGHGHGHGHGAHGAHGAHGP